MSGSVRLLGDVVADAQRANKIMRRQMQQHGIRSWIILHHLVVWPGPVKAAYDEWMARMVEIVTILGAGRGIDDVQTASQDIMIDLSERAYDLVLGERSVL